MKVCIAPLRGCNSNEDGKRIIALQKAVRVCGCPVLILSKSSDDVADDSVRAAFRGQIKVLM
jgi:hypothetical protein